MMRTVGGILLVAGTTIGGGILALPVVTAQAGLIPAFVLLCAVWAFMTYTAFLFLEATFAAPKGANLVSMARVTLGPFGELIAWASYMLLLYVLMAAYISGSGALLLEALADGFGLVIPKWVGPLPWAFVFGLLVYCGIRSVDSLNRFLMGGLIITYLVLVVVLGSRMDPARFLPMNFPYLVVPLSTVITTLGFHIIVPSLVDYLDRNVKRVRICLFIGCLIPLLIYLVWELVIIGMVPTDQLFTILKGGQPGPALSALLPTLTGSTSLGIVMRFFSLFALLTSFLGVSISLADFLRDGFKIAPSKVGRSAVTLLTFIPPLAFALLYPHGFIVALNYAGLFVAILLGLLPTAMVWAERYIRKKRLDYHVFGGRWPLLASFCFFSAVVILFFFEKTLTKLTVE